jgi:hypothetical protein
MSSLTLDLSSYPSLQTALFVKLDVQDYGTDRFSTMPYAYDLLELDGNYYSYTALGQLLAISDTSTDLRASGQELTITLSGIPTTNIALALEPKLRGSTVEVYRAYFDPTSGQLIDQAGNPSGVFQGIVNNFGLGDEIQEGSLSGTVSFTLICSSVVDVMGRKRAGRRTNPLDQRLYFPNDPSMDRVVKIANTNYDFGAPL